MDSVRAARKSVFISGKWAEAESEASTIIDNTALFNLQTDLNNVFLKNNSEAIFQTQISSFPFATYEGSEFIPEFRTQDFDSATIADNSQYFVPQYPVNNELANAFEPGDLRKNSWLDSTGPLNGVNYYYPYKYKIRKSDQTNIPEYNMVLRLSEQYLIRAEARANQDNLAGAMEDINTIRSRAGLAAISSSSSQTEVLNAIAQENRVEFCFEGGRRWFNLKRTNQADAVLSIIKGSNWQTTDQLYPVPSSELLLNPNLTQNEGYPR